MESLNFEERHTSISLSEQLENILNKWSLNGKIIATVHDNAANITKCIIDNKEIFGQSIPFFAHTLQLCVNSALQELKIKQLLKKCSTIDSFFHYSTVATNNLKAVQA